ncbi:MAG: ADP-forming succinate--CoA ligase subunit beta [Bacillota bacterium]|jgi:succinyl-CoA synthetase beta subunit
MKIHEYQAIALLKQYALPILDGQVALSVAEAVQAQKELGLTTCILKAQVHTGGRGKAGGVRRADTPEEVAKIAAEMLGSKLVTKQTGPEGKVIRSVLVTGSMAIKNEYYLSFIVDGGSAQIVMLASSAGGVEIEKTAAEAPQKIMKESIDITIGLRAYQARRIAMSIGIRFELVNSFIDIAQKLYRLFIEKDCSLVEINPLVETQEGRLVAIDAKLNFDQNALFRHTDILELRDLNEEDPREVAASQFDLNYIPLDGEIGCMVNGAGLAMATMDMIRHCGGRPANFLDVGGGATAAKVAGAFQILLADRDVKGLLINIFGGIMKCDLIAQGIVTAAEKTKVNVPIVVRLEGTNAALGKEILGKSGLTIIPADTLAQAAQTIVALSGRKEVSV